VTQYSRKYIAIHEISEWEGHLDTAKGKVHECEDALQKLRREIEVIDDNIGKLESGMENLKHAILQEPQHPRNFVAGSWVWAVPPNPLARYHPRESVVRA